MRNFSGKLNVYVAASRGCSFEKMIFMQKFARVSARFWMIITGGILNKSGLSSRRARLPFSLKSFYTCVISASSGKLNEDLGSAASINGSLAMSGWMQTEFISKGEFTTKS